ncbi:hypothetical protein SAMN05216551_1088 [Chitinasiproducens palmae]|uniref:Uncharacterized protein n=1 Tax=Chitinasiproducens palmae TaxID=1770053 RepID=A0A1H2PR34_9BURK|nr:hypothetical protein SAMN05216551_1088 [Chitinasiproducens palmae]
MTRRQRTTTAAPGPLAPAGEPCFDKRRHADVFFANALHRRHRWVTTPPPLLETARPRCARSATRYTLPEATGQTVAFVFSDRFDGAR